MILQFIILFIYQNRMLILQLRIKAMDEYSTAMRQNQYVSSMQFRTYLVALIVSTFIQKLYFSNNCIFFLIGSIWVPQIIRNLAYGYKEVPKMSYAISQTIHMLWIPIYIKGVDNNLLFLEPDYFFVSILSVWVFV